MFFIFFFLSAEIQSVALKFASKLVMHLLQNHQQVRENEQLNSGVFDGRSNVASFG